MKLRDFICRLEDRVSPRLAQAWDNVGLILGDPEQPVRRVLLAIDVTETVAQEAIDGDVDLILGYHPVIFDGLKRILAQGPGQVVYRLVRAGIAVYSPHTAYDAVAGGVNDALADVLGIEPRSVLGDPVADPEGPDYKIVTFVPPEHVEAVAEALFQAGAGRIGRYSHCGFQTSGTGTFLPLEGAQPAIGQPGQRERVEEIRLETVVREGDLPAVLAALRQSHPYETPAFDVFRHHDLEARLGVGRVGPLTRPARLDDLLEALKRATGVGTVGLVGPQDRLVERAAVCAGSCGKLLHQAVAAGCDLYVTGELRHHMALAAQQAGLTVVCLSHSVSERFALQRLAADLQALAPDVAFQQSRLDRDPFVWRSL